MILRSVTKHVQEQNWFAVFIDFFIVVVGVFIGIQVANWNDEQAATRRGDDYVARLLTDLRRDLYSGNNLIDYYTEVSQSTNRAIDLINDPESDPRVLVISAYRATEYAYTPRSTATWDEIVSAGEVGLLPRVVLDNGLSTYFASYDLRRDALPFLRQSTYRKKVRGLIPHFVQMAIRKGCSDVRQGAGFDNLIRFRAECNLDTTEALVEDAALKLREDKTLLNELQFHASNVGALHGQIVLQTTRIERLIVLLGG